MFCVKRTIELNKKDDIIHLRPLGDVHIGNRGCKLDEFVKSAKQVEQKDNLYTIGMGDYIDNVMAYRGGMVDKRWNPETVSRNTLTTEEQIDKFVEVWDPIKHKTVGLHAGNHEWATINQRRFIKDFCKPLNLPYLGRMAYSRLNFKYKGKTIRDYILFTIHGGFSSAKAGGVINRLEEIANFFDADVYLMGHTHDTLTRSMMRIYYDKSTNSMIERKCILGNTGTFLSGYEQGIDSYPEINPRGAKRVGTITLTFNPEKGALYAHD